MDTSQIIVIVVGIALIAFILWFFFGKQEGKKATASSGMQEVEITVEGGYEPGTIQLTAGVPVRLIFHRIETASCSEEVVLPDFGIRQKLPAHKKTAVEFTPDKPGRYSFTCGMGMLRGTLVVA
ncbi:cupredoxin domain-containing protein [Armatimonas sp.]|uniref:cupredoxin domain-containing protein n=1 Tax=Armatimonas sp. TaxID=1872638 RepID=UPI0037532A4A